MLKFKHDNIMSRHHVANPNAHKSLYEYLKKNKVVDLRENFTIIEQENGYGEIKASNKSKIFK